MKIYFFKDPKGNFGDDLNLWLWPTFLGDILDDNDSELFVGIGTLLNERLPANAHKHVFGSGIGYGSLPVIDQQFTFHAVRGHETAKALKLPPTTVITDPAILVRVAHFEKPANIGHAVGFMSTGHSLQNYDWESLCREIGFHYISCRSSVERVLYEMSSCKMVITEAMHGAIVADALRIPWIPVNCYGYVLDLKWRDWLSSLQLDYVPRRISPLYGITSDTDAAVQIKNAVKRGLRTCGVWSRNWSSPLPKNSTLAERDIAQKELLEAAASAPFLSADTLVDTLTDRYLELVEQFKRLCRARL